MGITVEGVLAEIGTALEPVRQRAADDELALLFAEIGLPAPDVVLAVPGVVSATATVVDRLGVLVPELVELVDAIGATDIDEIRRIVTAAVPVVKELVAAISTLADGVRAAATSAGSRRSEVEAFADELPERLVGFVISTYLDRHRPILGGVAILLGLIEVVPQTATANAPAYVRRTLRLDRLAPLLEDPGGFMTELHRWGAADFRWDDLLRGLVRFTSQASDRSFVQILPSGETVLRIGIVEVGRSNDPVPGVEARLRGALAAGTSVLIPLGEKVKLELRVESGIEANASVALLPPANLRIDPPTGSAEGEARIGLIVEDPSGDPLLLLGTALGARIEAGRLGASVGAELAFDVGTGLGTGDFVILVEIGDGRVVIDLGDADGFLTALLPDGGFAIDFALALRWSASGGLTIDGGAGLTIDIPANLDLGPIKVPTLSVSVGFDGAAITVVAAGSISARLGPFAAAIDKMGAKLALTFPDDGGNLGVANLEPGFQPPSGIGLSIDASVLKGGGFLGIDEERHEYAGILELTLGPVSIKAIGILTTELPGEADGWALLLLVYTEFSAVQLGFGFTLNGVGGIIGLQHGLSTDQLQSGLRTGVLDSVLFPVNPVANAPTLLPQLRLVFPITPGALTIGPVLKIGWSTPPLVTLSLGLVLQFDGVIAAPDQDTQLTRIVLLGQLKIQVPPDFGADTPELLKLLIDIIGSYEVREKALAIDARLRDSHVAGLPLTGSLVVRARFGADPVFILAVGGFHPRFTDLPPGIPSQDRVGIQLDYDIITVAVIGYTAITSNSFQIGAEASLVAAGGGFRVEAYLGFDALFIFEPVFRFEIDFRVGASVKYKSISLLSLRVTGILSGPGHWEVSGHASFSVLFWDVDIDFEVEWGDAPTPVLPRVDALGELVARLQADDAWTVQLPTGANSLATLRDPATDAVIAHPLAELSVMQRYVPLGVEVDRIGRSQPDGANQFDITSLQVGAGDAVTPTRFAQEHFARGEFLDLTEEEKLSTPSFERFDAGASVSKDDYMVAGSDISFEPAFETLYLEQEEPLLLSTGFLASDVFVALAATGAASQSAIRRDTKLRLQSVPVEVADPGFVVAEADTLRATGAAVAVTATEANQAAGATTAGTTVVERFEAM